METKFLREGFQLVHPGERSSRAKSLEKDVKDAEQIVSFVMVLPWY